MKESFTFKLDILKSEIEYINSSIQQINTMTNNMKNWATIVWGGILAVILQKTNLTSLIGGTAIIPILFLLVDARWRVVQRRFIYRQGQIRDFLNSEDLTKSFEIQDLANFIVLDPIAYLEFHTDERKEFANMFRVLRYGTITWLYLGLSAISVAIHFIVNQN